MYYHLILDISWHLRKVYIDCELTFVVTKERSKLIETLSCQTTGTSQNHRYSNKRFYTWCHRKPHQIGFGNVLLIYGPHCQNKSPVKVSAECSVYLLRKTATKYRTVFSPRTLISSMFSEMTLVPATSPVSEFAIQMRGVLDIQICQHT